MIKALQTFRVRPALPPELQPLAELVANLRWAWHPPTRELFRWADPEGYEACGRNPVELIGRLSSERVEALVADAAFCNRLAELRADLEAYLTGPRWAQSRGEPLPRVAYMSPEFGLTGVMQTYSGGLGVLAGDHLKAASDLGLDLLGVGLLYRHGYFRQLLDADGWQQERYPDLNPHRMPLRRLDDADGQPAVLHVPLGEGEIAVAAWLAHVGRVPLLLLDTDLPSNGAADRTITDRLYGGDSEHRLRQEVVLGVGGVQALALAERVGVIDAPPEVLHLNEGHAGFSQLERIRQLVTVEGLTFSEAIESARSGVVFTTHTPVPAGIDVFNRDLIERYFGRLARDCGIDIDRLMAIGQVEATPEEGQFNMAVMALRLCSAANGVSALHGRVARGMFARLWPGLDVSEVPIASVTNGVHAPTWVGREMVAVYDRHLPPDWRENPEAWSRAADIGDDVLWRARARGRERLVATLRRTIREQRLRRGESPAMLGWIDELFDPDALTIGFARRFAEYKRGTLLLRQPERLRALLTSTDRPVQLVFAGKAHPRDELGKGLIRELVHFSGDEALRQRLVFVEDYDMQLATALYAGADVWLNTPRRPHEACGTSGQKAVLNGALHLSTLDGWWDEWFDGDNGFAIGARETPSDIAQHDTADVESLYHLLERTVVPLFYDRAEGPLPRRWLARVRRSLVTLGPKVLATRMVADYAQDLYAPTARRSARATTDGHVRARELAAWRARVREAWSGVVVRAVHGDGDTVDAGAEREVVVDVELGDLAPADVRVELLHGPVLADGTFADPTRVTLAEHADGRFGGTFEAARPGEYGFAVRVLPAHPDLANWADAGLVRWAEPAGDVP